MPVIDTATSEQEANEKANYWAGQIVALGAAHIAGVRKVCTSGRNDTWDIMLENHVDENSSEFRNFMRKFGH